MTPNYRADIDGLRAIAVLSVLFYHSGFDTFSGGFVGVDIFFVISGFLITKIIAREIEVGQFTIRGFYERRVRRILPAVTVVTGVTLLVGAALLHSIQFFELAGSALATSLFSSNILFYFRSDYFAGPTDLMPLLHTWSLAIEEQFYVVFPLLMIVIARFDSSRYMRWLLPITIVSFTLCVVGTTIDTSASFYMLPTRAWELLTGSLLATNIFMPIGSRIARAIAATLGLSLLAFSVLTFTPTMTFPGAIASIPVIGAALIIHSGANGDSIISRLLSIRPLVGVGLISYSIYLWHWPVIVFVKYYIVRELNVPETVGTIALVFGLAILTWRYVESPFRTKRLCKRPSHLFRVSFVASLLIVVSGLLILNGRGFPERFAHEDTMQFEVNDTDWSRWRSCDNRAYRPVSAGDLCKIGSVVAPTSFILWGDSHARSLATAVHGSAVRFDIGGEIAIQNGCPPLLRIERRNRLSCHNFNESVLQYISENEGIRTVILAARWALTENGTRYKREAGMPIQIVDLENQANTESSSNSELLDVGLNRTIQALADAGKKVVLVGPVPEIGYNVPAATFAALRTGRSVDSIIAPTTAEFANRSGRIDAMFSKIALEYKGVTIVSPSEYLCGDDICVAAPNNIPLYRDGDHLSTHGSRSLSHAFDELFALARPEANDRDGN